jgi:hypothetical protein
MAALSWLGTSVSPRLALAHSQHRGQASLLCGTQTCSELCTDDTSLPQERRFLTSPVSKAVIPHFALFLLGPRTLSPEHMTSSRLPNLHPLNGRDPWPSRLRLHPALARKRGPPLVLLGVLSTPLSLTPVKRHDLSIRDDIGALPPHEVEGGRSPKGLWSLHQIGIEVLEAEG